MEAPERAGVADDEHDRPARAPAFFRDEEGEIGQDPTKQRRDPVPRASGRRHDEEIDISRQEVRRPERRLPQQAGHGGVG
jgi:hypothetical protein